jgi:hypothetical protein
MKRKCRLIILAGLLASALVGCLTVRGGGWIPSALVYYYPEAKATFGINLACNSKTNNVQGQLDYQDNVANVAFHGTIPKTPLADYLAASGEGVPPEVTESCVSLDEWAQGQSAVPPGSTLFYGQYRPQVDDVDCSTTPEACGQFFVFAVENPDIGCPDGKGVSIALQGGLYDGYGTGGCLNGGNITLFE